MDHHEIYLKLIDRLNKNKDQFPPIKPVVELVKLLFSPEQAALGAAFPMGAHTLENLSQCLGWNEQELALLVDAMESDGLLFSARTQTGEKEYSLVPFFPGLIEHQFLKGEDTPTARKAAHLLVKIREELAPLAEKAYQTPPPTTAEINQLRVLPIEKELSRQTEVADWERISNYLDQETSFAMGTCACRQEHALLGTPCKIENVPMETCLYFGKIADYMVERGYCKPYTRDEVKARLKTFHAKGLVSNVNNWEGDNIAMCHCCGCCCSFFQEIKRYGVTARRRQITSNFTAMVDGDTCIGCGECQAICQVNAVRMDTSGETAQVDENYCLGCGNCVPICPTDSITLERSGTYKPPKQKEGIVGYGE